MPVKRPLDAADQDLTDRSRNMDLLTLCDDNASAPAIFTAPFGVAARGASWDPGKS